MTAPTRPTDPTEPAVPPSGLDPALEARLVEWRRHLHAHPELAFHEHETAAYVEAQLRAVGGFEVSRPTPTSVLGVLRGGAGAGRTVLVRADMDALPIHEENDVDYASTNPGVMHACGHDGHTAMLLGVAQWLVERRATLRGEYRLIFQHAEELFPGGAQELVDVGVADGVDAAIGAHLFSPIPVGHVALKSGALLAAPDAFEITVHGRGGHGALPHETIDPVVIAAQVVLALQTIVSRSRDPLEPAVLSVTTIHGGSAHNVIPESVTLGGTVRTFDPALRERIPRLMERTVAGVTAAFGATHTLRYEFGYRATVNDPAVTEVLRGVVRDTLGEEALIEATPSMGGEDFSAFLARVPGAFVLVGARSEAAGSTAPHHHPRFALDERALALGTRVLAEGAARLAAGD